VDAPERSYQLADYEPVIEAAERSQIEAVLVGGQAVYFWATRYRAQCPELEGFLPYTSQDADYLADEGAARILARSLNSYFLPSPRKGGMLGLSLGHIPLKHGMDVEILGCVNGLKGNDVRTSAVRLKWRGKQVNVIHPVQLYIGKGHNLVGLDQSDRQDRKHFAIMQWVMRMFLADLAAMNQPEAAKSLLACCERLIGFSRCDVGLKLIRMGDMPQNGLWPNLSDHTNEKLQNFARQRAPRWQQELASKLEKWRAREQRQHRPSS
jgi:hypothetical protein